MLASVIGSADGVKSNKKSREKVRNMTVLICEANVTDCNHRRVCTKYSGQDVSDDINGGRSWMRDVFLTIS